MKLVPAGAMTHSAFAETVVASTRAPTLKSVFMVRSLKARQHLSRIGRRAVPA